MRMGKHISKDRNLSGKNARRVCAWCKRVLDGKGPVKPEEIISHGICKACADRVVRKGVMKVTHFEEVRDDFEELLDAETLDRDALSDLHERVSVGSGGPLSPEQRKRIPKRMFVFPEKRAWPIHDLKHAKIALIWSTWPQHKDVAKKVRSEVFKRYPELKKWFKGGAKSEGQEHASLGRLGDIPGLAERLQALQHVIEETQSLKQ